MSLIQEAASYRGVVVEHAVSATSSGLPQLVVKLRALEHYDFDEKTWIDWTSREDCEITGYLVLFDKKGEPIFHVKDIQNVYEWDGASLTGLEELDLEGAETQFEVIQDTYEGKTRLKVARISKYDDVPGTGAVKKLDADELTALNAKFAAGLKKSGGGPKPVKATKTTTTTTATTTPPAPPAAKTEEEATADAAAPVAEPVPEKSTKKATKPKAPPVAPPAPPAPPKAPAKQTATEAVKGRELAYETAWAECYNGKLKTVTDEQLATAFTAAMHRIASGQAEGEISPEDWGKIADTVLGECGGK